MRNPVSGLTLLLSILALASVPAQEVRTFTSSDGKELEALILDASDKDVTLKRVSDDKEFVIPLERLSEEDRTFMAEWLAKKVMREDPNFREAREVELALEGGKTETVKVPEGKHLSEDGVLTLYPDDTVHLEFPEGGGKNLKAKVVKDVTHPERTVTFSLSQQDGLTMLSRSTAVKQTVAMDCKQRAVGSEEWVRTNLRPTTQGLTGFDSWPGGVFAVQLSNFEVTDRPVEEVYMERVAE